MMRRVLSYIVPLVVVAALSSSAMAQRGSLYQAQFADQPLTLENHSWLFVPQQPVRELQINDLVMIQVAQKMESVSAGKVNQVTTSSLDARLRDWVILEGFGFKPDPQTFGDPRARGSLDSQLRTNADLATSAKMTFNISATIVDIRPNGNLVLEAHSSFQDNGEVYEQSLSGIVRREDVAPGNVIQSERIAELSVHKRETGHIRDAYRRGWALKFYDSVKPF